jgi:hypothetical protein
MAFALRVQPEFGSEVIPEPPSKVIRQLIAFASGGFRTPISVVSVENQIEVNQ